MTSQNGNMRRSSSSLAECVDQILHSVQEQRRDLEQLKYEVVSIRDTVRRAMPNGHDQGQTEAKRDTARKAWEQIHCYNPSHDVAVLRALVSHRNTVFKDLFSPKQPWNTWNYKLSYPKLTAFINGGSLHARLAKSRLRCSDGDERGNVVQHWLIPSERGTDPEDVWRWGSMPTYKEATYEEFWQILRNRVAISEGSLPVDDCTLTSTSRPGLIKIRCVEIIGLTSTIAIMSVASAPRMHMSLVAQFLDRYLSFCNWARVTLHGLAPEAVKSCTFEYHIAFYTFYPAENSALEQPRQSSGGVRRTAMFGPDQRLAHGDIHEEQLSCLYVGFGHDWGTFFELGENWRRDIIRVLQRGSGSYTGPSSLFFSWLISAMVHIVPRWTQAIDAIDSAYKGPSDIVFSGVDFDLLSDDPVFSQSRNYYWALQACKMFEDRLRDTIQTWEKFRRDFAFDDTKMPFPPLPNELSQAIIKQHMETLTRRDKPGSHDTPVLPSTASHFIPHRHDGDQMLVAMDVTEEVIDARRECARLMDTAAINAVFLREVSFAVEDVVSGLGGGAEVKPSVDDKSEDNAFAHLMMTLTWS